MLRISQIKLGLNDDISKIISIISTKLNIREEDILKHVIYKESIDARKRDVKFAYTVDFQVNNEEKYLNKYSFLSKSPDLTYKSPSKGTKNLTDRPLIVGAGPAGLYCALILAENGYNPLVLERGEDVDDRSKTIKKLWALRELNTESNVQFGEGGAGTFSDGKLTTRIKDLRCRKILEEMVEAGAPKEILFMNKPHVGRDKLKNVVKQTREKIISLGGEFKFSTRVDDLIIEDDKLKGVITNKGETIKSEVVVLAIGHSARDTFEMIHKRNVSISPKPFALGVRIEHPQVMINKAQFKENYKHERLGSAEYHLTHQASNGRSVYTFCMCPGGYVVNASSENNRLVVNGMSYHARTGVNANSALLVNIKIEDYFKDSPLDGMYFQRELEEKAFVLGGGNFNAPVQLVKDYISNKKTEALGSVKPTFKPDVTYSNISSILPEFVNEALRDGITNLGRKLSGFSMHDAVLTAIETRTSSPIRIERDNITLECINIPGLYPCGEGAGFAGGIISSAVDGVKVAENIVSTYAAAID